MSAYAEVRFVPKQWRFHQPPSTMRSMAGARRLGRDVRFVPIADIALYSITSSVRASRGKKRAMLWLHQLKLLRRKLAFALPDFKRPDTGY